MAVGSEPHRRFIRRDKGIWGEAAEILIDERTTNGCDSTPAIARSIPAAGAHGNMRMVCRSESLLAEVPTANCTRQAARRNSPAGIAQKRGMTEK